MTNPVRTLAAAVALLALAACSQEQEAPQSSTTLAPTQPETTASSSPVADANAAAFKPSYISAEDLGARYAANDIPFVFDVRSTAAFKKSHIVDSLSMPYGQTGDTELAAVEGLNKDSEIVTYCGCPRHLSGLAAKDLEGRGYTNVKVLYDGFWVWIEEGYPTYHANQTAAVVTPLHVAGSVSENDVPTAATDVFLRHRNSGQLEAVRTGSDGAFAVDFHLYDYRPGDEFDVMLGSLDSAPVMTVTLGPDRDNRFQVTL